MKRYFETTIFGLLSLLAFTACSEDEGTEPGGDSAPHVAIIQSSVVEPYDADIDQNLRFAVNQQTEAVYYLAEKTVEKEARGMNTDAYADYVVANGTQVQLNKDEQTGGKYGEVIATGMKGVYTITAVAVGGSKKSSSSVAFTGPNWIDVSKGTYYFSARAQGRLGVGETTATVLQYLESDPTQYRFKNLYGYGASLRMTLSEKKGSDDTGELQYFRVEGQTTPFTYGDYGTISVRDLGYWQDDDSYAFDPDYGCFIYTNANKNGVVLALQYFVSAGSLGYGWDEFEPKE
jgi:hypothetical protein